MKIQRTTPCPASSLMPYTIIFLSSIRYWNVGIDVARMSPNDLCNLLLYGKPHVSTFVNMIILEATISFVKSSKRFA